MGEITENIAKTLRTTLPPHHLVERTEMRRERQSDIKSSRSSPQESNSRIPSPRMNRGDRSELACTERATRGSSTPPVGPSRAEGEENPREALMASRDLPKVPALLKEGRDTKENPGMQDFRRSQRKDIGAVEAKLANKISVNKSKQTHPLRRRPIKNICHSLILSSKPIATPRN